MAANFEAIGFLPGVHKFTNELKKAGQLVGRLPVRVDFLGRSAANEAIRVGGALADMNRAALDAVERLQGVLRLAHALRCGGMDTVEQEKGWGAAREGNHVAAFG